MKLLTLSMLAFAMLSQNSDRLVILPRAASTQPKASVAGTIVSDATGEPLAGATVTLSRQFANLIDLLSEDGPLPVIPPTKTDERGRFSFPAIESAAYDLSVQMSGYVRGTAGLKASAGQRVEGMNVRLIRAASIGGQVQSSAGQPLPEIPVRLFKRVGQETQSVIETKTAADGSYRLADFPPGDYVLAAGTPTPLNGEAAASFARSIAAPAAGAIRLDISLNPKERYTARGNLQIKEAPASQGAAVEWTVRVTAAGKGATALPGVNVRYDPRTGDFEIRDLAPGIYRVSALLTGPPHLSTCSGTDAVISQSDVSGLQLVLQQCR